MPYIAHSSSSYRCFDLIKTWLNECRDNHESCAKNSGVPLPSRVIDIGDDNHKPRLFVTNGKRGEYLTLSYCWGGISRGVTLKSNIQERLTVISLDTLCKTHQDAILITRRLGFKYLWIDALCIVQDDYADWEDESSKMFSIYRDSVLTLAAASSSNGDGGIFSKRPYDVLATSAIILGIKYDDDEPENYKLPEIDILVSRIELDPNTPEDVLDSEALVKDAGEFNGPFLLVRKPVLSHGIYSYGFHKYHTATDFPLEDRAWCLQERILSTRIVHFSRDELVWECKCSTQCECGGISSREGAITLREHFEVFLQNEDPRVRSDTWMEMVSKCTKRKITNESDRLPTLSGLARCLQEQGFGKYLAGLWMEHLPAQLLWCTYYGDQARRASTYRAPSWSFASVENASFNNALETMFRTHRHFLASFSSAECRPAGTDPTGNVAEGHITITGPVQQSSLEFRFVRYNGQISPIVRCGVYALGRFRKFLNDISLFEPNESTTFNENSVTTASSDPSSRQQKNEQELVPLKKIEDGSLQPFTGGPVILLAICIEQQTQMQYHGKGVESLFCLVLKPTAGDVDQHEVFYERIGVLKLDQEDEPEQWLQGAQEATLTIL
jgi:Heterokaryon incompatibility protein (HET)